MLASLVSFVFLTLFTTKGAILLALGLRGRRLDDHRVCRRCRYDLLGAPEAQVCPECGASLASPRALQIGNRKRRPGWIVAGSLLLALGLGPVALVALSRATAANLNPHKPNWMLRWEASQTFSPTAEPALREVLARLQARTVSPGEMERLMDAALAVQADASRPWLDEWGDVVTAVHAANGGTPAQFERYVRGIADTRVVVRPQVRHGDDIPFTFYVKGRGGSRSQDIAVRYAQGEFVISGLRFPWSPGGSRGLNPTTGSMTVGRVLQTGKPPLDALGVGNHEVRYSCDVMATVASSPRPLASYRLEFRTRAEIVSPEGDAPRLRQDPAAAAQVEKALSVHGGGSIVFTTSNPEPPVLVRGQSLGVRVDPLPFAIGYQVVLVRDGREWPMQKVARGPSAIASGLHGTNVPLDVPDVVDVHFRPSLEAARRTVDVFEVLDHPFVIRDVAVEGP